MSYAIKLSDAFQLLDNGRLSTQQNGGKRSTKTSSNGSLQTEKRGKAETKKLNFQSKTSTSMSIWAP